jgi:pSer/pThr/pTyr-binding forkhead associated (FHA) protein
VYIKILQTIDASQMREETHGLPCVIGRKNGHMTITGDPKISRAHAEINMEGGKFIITDRDSVNGTVVADTQLKKGGSTSFAGRTIVRLGPNTIIEVEPKE